MSNPVMVLPPLVCTHCGANNDDGRRVMLSSWLLGYELHCIACGVNTPVATLTAGHVVDAGEARSCPLWTAGVCGIERPGKWCKGAASDECPLSSGPIVIVRRAKP